MTRRDTSADEAARFFEESAARQHKPAATLTLAECERLESVLRSALESAQRAAQQPSKVFHERRRAQDRVAQAERALTDLRTARARGPAGAPQHAPPAAGSAQAESPEANDHDRPSGA